MSKSPPLTKKEVRVIIVPADKKELFHILVTLFENEVDCEVYQGKDKVGEVSKISNNWYVENTISL